MTKTTYGSSGVPVRVLFVDDDPQLLRATERFIRAARPGWQVTCVSNGKKAQKLLRSERYHALVTDLDMPHMNGEQLIHQVSQAHPGILCIVRSGSRELEAVAGCPQVHGAVPKTAHPNLLCYIIEAELQRREGWMPLATGSSGLAFSN